LFLGIADTRPAAYSAERISASVLGKPDANPEEIECSPGLRARPDPTVTSQQFAMPVSQQMLHGHCQVLDRLVTALYFFLLL